VQESGRPNSSTPLSASAELRRRSRGREHLLRVWRHWPAKSVLLVLMIVAIIDAAVGPFRAPGDLLGIIVPLVAAGALGAMIIFSEGYDWGTFKSRILFMVLVFGTLCLYWLIYYSIRLVVHAVRPETL